MTDAQPLQPTPGAPGAPPPAPAKQWYRRKGIVIPGGIFVVLAVIGALTPSDKDTSAGSTRRDNTADGRAIPAGTSEASGYNGQDRAPAGESSSPTPAATTAPPTTAPPVPAPNSAAALLARLAVKGRAPKTGYTRDAFGQPWADTDRNGCDTRNDMLNRDLTARVHKAGTGGCKVLEGDLADPYTATRIHFAYGGASEVDIDHVVSLSDAWQKGATPWHERKRLAFANDPLNLLAVSASANRQKADSDAASWLPPNKSYRCAMVARQVAVKAKYGLWVTSAERDAIARVLATCPGQVAPSGGNPTMAPFSAPASRPQPQPTTAAPAPTSGGSCDSSYPDVCIPPPPPDLNCDNIQYTNFRVIGDDPHRFDADDDGIGCERN